MQNEKHVISCYPTGTVEAVQNDELSLQELGKVQMTRASDVTWDGISQTWQAIIRPEFRKEKGWDYGMEKCPWVFFHKSREKCIAWEINYLNNR